jgi:hypothetical protein
MLAEVGITCPLSIALTFAVKGSVDSSCIASMPTQIDLGGVSKPVQQVAQQYFGTANLWD